MLNFLQDNGLTTRIVLHEDDNITAESKLMWSDLTEKGLAFYRNGITPWIKRIDRSTDKEKTILDTAFLRKKLAQMEAQ